MSVSKTVRTYVLYAKNDKLAVAEEESFGRIIEGKNGDGEAEEVQEVCRQTFLFPQVEELSGDDDLGKLIDNDDNRVAFVQKAINAKLSLYVNQTMRRTETVKVVAEDGEEQEQERPTFSPSTTAIDLTAIVGEAPKRERLTQDVKIKRVLEGMSKEAQAQFLKEMLAAMEQEAEEGQ
jgi:hypothetical protein